MNEQAVALADALLDAGYSFHDAKRVFERAYAREALRRTHGVKTRAAALIKKDKRDFYDLLIRTGLHTRKG